MAESFKNEAVDKDDVLNARHINVVFDDRDVRRLPGRDVEISDDEGDADVALTSKPIEIVEEKPKHPPRKSSLLLIATPKPTSTRKRSVTFEPIDVAGIKPPSPKQFETDEGSPDEEDEIDFDMEQSEMSLNALSSPIAIEQLRLRVSEELPDTAPSRGSKRSNEARPPTPPGASHRVKYPKTPPPTPMDTKYI